VGKDDVLYHGKAEPRAPSCGLGGEERLENALAVFLANAFAIVGNRQPDVAGGIAKGAHDDSSAFVA